MTFVATKAVMTPTTCYVAISAAAILLASKTANNPADTVLIAPMSFPNN